jgi:hypothetical protein
MYSEYKMQTNESSPVIAFSLPVHEKCDVIIDQIENIHHYCPNAIVIIHVSKNFTGFDPVLIQDIPNVYINDKRYKTELHQGFFLLHCSNFDFLTRNGIRFEKFCIISSNELFIRQGIAEYINQNQNGLQAVELHSSIDWHGVRKIKNNEKIGKLLERLKIDSAYGGQAEGQFYEKQTFQIIRDHYIEIFGENEFNGFETEEIVPQTIAMSLNISYADPFTLVDYSHPACFRITPHVVRKLSSSEYIGRILINIGPKKRGALVSPHYQKTNDSVFSVKRVNRMYDDPVRKHIRTQIELQTESVVSSNASNQKQADQIKLIRFIRIQSLHMKMMRRFGKWGSRIKKCIRRN